MSDFQVVKPYSEAVKEAKLELYTKFGDYKLVAKNAMASTLSKVYGVNEYQVRIDLNNF